MRKVTLPFALLLAGALQGCSTGPQFFGQRDTTSRHEPGSDAWWAEKAMLPPGVRQECKKGKVWPARPRSTQPPQQLSHTFYSAHYWPLPYTCQDAQAVWGTMEQFTSLGWQEQTTISNRHFDPTTQQLTKSGELHLSYILHVVPVDRRAVYVQSTYDAALDSMRMESVHQAIARNNYPADQVTVALRDCQEIGRPAAEVQMINEMYLDTTPTPRLGDAGSGSGGGDSSGGGGESGE